MHKNTLIGFTGIGVTLFSVIMIVSLSNFTISIYDYYSVNGIHEIDNLSVFDINGKEIVSITCDIKTTSEMCEYVYADGLSIMSDNIILSLDYFPHCGAGTILIGGFRCAVPELVTVVEFMFKV